MKNLFLFCMFACMVMFFSCHKNTSDNNTDNIDGTSTTAIANLHENTIQQINNLLDNGNDLLAAVNNCIETIKQSSDVRNAYLQDDNIVIIYNSGVVSIIAFIDENGESGKGTPSNMNFENNKNKKTTKTESGTDLITNHNVLIWEPYASVGYGADILTGDYLQNKFESSSLGFTVTHLKENQCTLNSLKNITQYGFIYIKTHGGVFKNSNGEDVCWIATAERYFHDSPQTLTSQNEKIFVTIANVTYETGMEVTGLKVQGEPCWGISNKYISNQVNGVFNSPAVVFVQACHSFDNLTMRNAFIDDKKASVYLGYQNAVSHTFGRQKGLEFVQNMLEGEMDAPQAYNAILLKADYSILGVIMALAGNPTYLTYSSKLNSNPTYYGQGNYVECLELHKKWTLQSSTYINSWWNSYSSINFFSVGDSIEIFFNLTRMTNMLEGTYTPYIVNQNNEDLFEDNFNIPFRFIVGGDEYWGSCFWIGDNNYDISNGQLTYHILNNNQKNYTFDFTGSNGYSYHGEYTE